MEKDSLFIRYENAGMVLAGKANMNAKQVLYQCGVGMCPVAVLYECGLGACPQVTLYECGPAGCPKVTLSKCVLGACPEAEQKGDVVVIEHPNEPEKGRVEMTKEEWNALIANAKSAVME